MEAAAASHYWKAFFDFKFKRERFGDYPNNFLNYGYAILRAATARALAGSGLENFGDSYSIILTTHLTSPDL
jgi:CRISPR-associated protein Cas1